MTAITATDLVTSNFLNVAMLKFLIVYVRTAYGLAIFIQRFAINVKAKAQLKLKAITSMINMKAAEMRNLNNLNPKK
jgi:hypothetical protein